MRRRTGTMIMTTLALAASVAFAGPASADHDSGLNEAGTECFLGAWDSGIRQNVRGGTAVQIRTDSAGVRVGYKCSFDNIPSETLDGGGGVVWTRPTRATVRRVVCWRPQDEVFAMGTGIGRLQIRPNGTATLTCHWPYRYVAPPASPV